MNMHDTDLIKAVLLGITLDAFKTRVGELKRQAEELRASEDPKGNDERPPL